MEKNEAERKMEEKMKLKGKISARDLEFQRKFQMKRRQMALKALHAYSKSLTGSDKLHPPIIMKEDPKDEKAKDKKDDKKEAKKDDNKDEKEKLSKKHQELLEKRKLEEEEKIKEHDRNQMKQWDPSLDSIAEIIDPEKLEREVLDLLLGFNRITDSFVGFHA